jgi:hypothetical protein
MDFDLNPRVGVQGLALGSSRGVVRQFFGAPPKVFRRTPEADYWQELGAFACYNGDGMLDALEFASPADLNIEGKSVTSMSMADALTFLRSLDPEVTIKDGGASAHSQRLGIRLWCPSPELPNAKVEAALVFGDSYYR